MTTAIIFGPILSGALPNNGTHPTRFSVNVIENSGGFEVVSGRVGPGVGATEDTVF